VLPGSIGIVVLVNTCALVVALVVAELGVQLVTGRRLSSEEMLAEFRREAGGPTLDPDRRITTTDDLRTTIGQPGGDAPRVYVFGGSTIYGGEVDDAETIPSMLQGRLNSVDVSATVLNYGQVMVDAVYSNAWLQSLTSEARPRPGDVVVFYVGVNDAGASFAYLSRIDRWSAAFDNLAAPMRTLNRRSAIASQTFAWLGRGRVTANDQTSSLRAALDDARTFAESLGARFVAILQPTLFTERAPDEYERTLAERLGRDLVRAVDEIYPIVSEVVLASPGAVDARGALSAVEPSPFVDWMHLDGRGNAAIAAMMEAAVTPLLVP
jgi:lysophospholipase L1-like esterase